MGVKLHKNWGCGLVSIQEKMLVSGEIEKIQKKEEIGMQCISFQVSPDMYHLSFFCKI